MEEGKLENPQPRLIVTATGRLSSYLIQIPLRSGAAKDGRPCLSLRITKQSCTSIVFLSFSVRCSRSSPLSQLAFVFIR
jgi:hypothetical protein